MRPHKVLFISIGLTTFVLAMLTGVISAVKGKGNNDTATVSATAVATITPVALDARQAAGVASQYLNSNEIYSVETASISGTMGYKVVFSSGDVVYVSQGGQVLATDKIQPAMVVRSVQSPAPASGVVVSAASLQQQTVASNDHEEHDNDDD